MKTVRFILQVLLLNLAICQTVRAQEWIDDLVRLNPGVIDSVRIIHGGEDKVHLKSYMIHYHQPLQHANPELGSLPLRALLTVRDDADFLGHMTQVNIGGYALNDICVAFANLVVASYFSLSQGELAGRYDGNLLQPEHRYFGKSCPPEPLKTLSYCEAEEAAADFHALLDALKKVFKCKWAITGGSKGGMTVAIQQAYYPDDADCYVPYAAPFLNYEHDTRMQEYSMTEPLTPELREKMFHIEKQMLTRKSMFDKLAKYVCDSPDDEEEIHELRLNLLMTAGLLNFDLMADSTREASERLFKTNEEFLKSKGCDDYTDEMLIYMYDYDSPEIDDWFDFWYEYIYKYKLDNGEPVFSARKSPLKHKRMRRIPLPDDGDDDDDDGDDDDEEIGAYPYYYQAAHELGYFDLKWDCYYDTQEEIDSVNAMWHDSFPNYLMVLCPELKEVEYNPGLMNYVRSRTKQSSKPILFVYGKDDPWAGAHMDDDCINGDNVKMYILPFQNHANVSIGHITDPQLRDELWAFLDKVFADSPDAIEDHRCDDVEETVFYDLMGRRVRPDDVNHGRRVLISKSRGKSKGRLIITGNR